MMCMREMACILTQYKYCFPSKNVQIWVKLQGTQKFGIGMRLHTRCICCPTVHLSKRQEIIMNLLEVLRELLQTLSSLLRGQWKSRKWKWNGNWKQKPKEKMETEMEMQPLSCFSPSKICVLLAFIPRHPELSLPSVLD